MSLLEKFESVHGSRAGHKSHSQNDEEFVVLEYFGAMVGRFLDVGAYDGITISNTYALAQRGWRGVCVEPDPVALVELQKTHAGNDKIAVAGVAVCPKNGVVVLHTSGGAAVSTTIKSHSEKWSAATPFEDIAVTCVSPARLLDRHPGPFEFFSLDTEGTNADLLELFPLSEMGVELLCVEHDCQDERILSHCKRHGLTRVLARNAENLIIGK